MNNSSWSQLLASVDKPSQEQQLSIVVCGFVADQDWELPHSDIDLARNLDYASGKDNANAISYQCYYLPCSEPGLAKVVAEIDGPLTVIICFDWASDLSLWPARLTTFLDLAYTHNKTAAPKSLIFACFNHRSVPHLELRPSTDYAQHWLRARALQLDASIVYVTRASPIRQLVYQGLEIDLAATSNQSEEATLERQLVGDVLIPRGWDSAEKILATCPDFPLEDVLAGQDNFPILGKPISIPSVSISSVIEPLDLSQLEQKFKLGQVPETPVSVLQSAGTVSASGAGDSSNRVAVKSLLTDLIDRNY